MGPTDLLLHTAEVLERIGIRYFVAGSMAAMFYGEYRSTHDVDVVVFLRFGKIPFLVEAFPPPEWYLDPLTIHDAMEHCGQFNLIHVPTALKVDFMTPEEDYYNEVRFERARRKEVAPGKSAWFAAPEDVILKKLEYYKEGGSDKHLRDIDAMIRISGETFDREYLEKWASTLKVTVEWNAVKRKAGW